MGLKIRGLLASNLCRLVLAVPRLEESRVFLNGWPKNAIHRHPSSTCCRSCRGWSVWQYVRLTEPCYWLCALMEMVSRTGIVFVTLFVYLGAFFLRLWLAHVSVWILLVHIFQKHTAY